MASLLIDQLMPITFPGEYAKKEQELREDLHGNAFLLPNVPNCSQYTKSNFGAEYEDSHQMVKFCKGTTTLAFKFRGGVIVSVDSRATQGQFIGGNRLNDLTLQHPTLFTKLSRSTRSFWERWQEALPIAISGRDAWEWKHGV